jgi:replicative DNA helicase
MHLDDLRIPPHSIEAEQSVIGGILLDNQSYIPIAELLSDTDFYREDHQLIFRSMADMAENNEAIDVLTVSEWMKGRFVKRGNHQQSFFDIIGGLAYLGDLAKDTPSSANIVAYANMVSNYSLKRQVIHFALELVNQGFAKGSDNAELTELLEFMVASAFALEQKKMAINNDFTPMKQALKQQVTLLSNLRDNDGNNLLGASSTLEALDAQLSGFEKGKVYVLAGRPAMGKTTLGLNLVEGIASTTGGVVAVFSLEMPTEQIITKMLSSQGRIDFSHLRSPWELSDTEWGSLHNSVKKLKKMDIFFDDQAAHSPASLRARCRRLVQRTGKPLSAILIDYVQLMHGSIGKNYVNREAEVSAISGEIRALAKDFNCPVILLSQLNRSVEGRPNKRPVLSDLRESGALEQDASCVLFIYRDEVYDKKSKAIGIAELIVAKHGGGKTGTIRCAFVGKNQRFANKIEVTQ